MEKYKYINRFTGEIHKTLISAVIGATMDMLHCKTCRTLKIYNISRLREK